MWFIVFLLLMLVIIFAIGHYFNGEDLRQYDSDDLSATFFRPTPSYKYPAALDLIASMNEPFNLWQPNKFLLELRKKIDRLGDVALASRITPVYQHQAGQTLIGEWVIAEHADVNKRLLYIHGGAFAAGSAKSHRIITDRLSRELGVAVFAVNYQLIPDGNRKQGITDCRNAYQWLLENGPQGTQAALRIYVAGDSAGGNLTLALLNWLKQQNLRQADAAIALCPYIDSTFNYASLQYNAKTDFLLNPVLGKLHRLPRVLLLFWVFITFRVNPRDPQVSPVFANLAGLPPVLIHASDTEMMVDDARRYTNKARALGSDVRLQTWSNMLHVWHLFDLDEADEAYAEIAKFITQCETNICAKAS